MSPAILLVAVLAATPKVAAGVAVTTFELPASPTGDFTVCAEALPVVALGDGMWVAGTGFVPVQKDEAIVSVGCADDGTVHAVTEKGVVLRIRGGIAKGKPEPVYALPAGKWHLSATATGPFWLWGRTASGASVILRAEAGALRKIYSGTREVTAASVAGVDHLLTAIEGELWVFKAGTKPQLVSRVGAPVVGLAAGPARELAYATSEGVFELGQPGQRPRRLASGISGPLVTRGARLYVLPRGQQAVVALEQPESKRQPAAEPSKTARVPTEPAPSHRRPVTAKPDEPETVTPAPAAVLPPASGPVRRPVRAQGE